MTKCKPIVHRTSCKCGYIMTIEFTGVLRVHGNLALTCPSCKLINSMSII